MTSTAKRVLPARQTTHHTLDPFLLYLSSSVIFPGLPLAPHTQGTPNKKSILSTRQCHHNYSSQTAIEDKLHLHCLFTRSLWLSGGPLCLRLLFLILGFHPRPSVFACQLKPGWKYREEGQDTGTGRPGKKSPQHRHSVASTLCEISPRLIVDRTVFRGFWAAAAKCATVILLQHSLIKAFVDISSRWRPDWEKRKTKTAS